MAAPRVTLGRVAGVFGVRGWVKIHSYTRPVTNILDYPRWWIAHGEGYETQLLEGRAQGRGIVAQISDASGAPITDRNVALGLIGAEIGVERTELPKLPKGQHYWIDLIGFRVESTAGEPLGEVRDMTSNGAQDVMVLHDGERERLVPFVKGPIVQSVDPKARRIVCEWSPDY